LDKKVIETALFHDISKKQPTLSVGQKVFTKDVFEDGKMHAERSAEKALKKYNITKDVYYYILYHHHSESELHFKKYNNKNWLITYRLFKIIDGLSAAITRSKACIQIGFDSYGLFVAESNPNINYNGIWYHNLHTGQKIKFANLNSL